MASIEGVLERIVFQNKDNYFTVARLNCSEIEGEVTLVGSLPTICVGETLFVSGEWINHPSYGKQFQVETYNTVMPASLAGIEKYLASGSVKGIGPQTARIIVGKFGEDTLDVLENKPELLLDISGIGAKKLKTIVASFSVQKDIRAVMIFLQRHGITPVLAAKIYKQYGDRTVAALSDNPYGLADDLYGVGFKTADKLAARLGMKNDSPQRIAAGIRYTLSQMAGNGHVYVPREELEEKCAEMLEVSIAKISPLFIELEKERFIYIEHFAGDECIYLAPFFHAETGVSVRLRELSGGQPESSSLDISAEIDDYQKKKKVKLAAEQKEAVLKAVSTYITVITGGPGTGKTTTIRTLLHMFEKMGLKVDLCAPTGRAAKRMTEATGRPAKTIHRMLEYSNSQGGGFRFQKDENNPLESDVLIVDEISMVDILLMYALLKAVPSGTRIVLVGDRNQLPSVGPGNVLADIIDSSRIETVELKHIFRQAGGSSIAYNAQRINEGSYPFFDGKDFYMIEENDPQLVLDTIVSLVTERLPEKTSFDPWDDIQVLSPMRKTVIGVENLNAVLQQKLNPVVEADKELRLPFNVFRVGDKVMQIRNNYEKGVFNGDMGRISDIDKEEGVVLISYPEPFRENIVIYDFSEMDECTLAYAVSVHKSQGSEYPAVVIPVSTSHFVMLQRNLLYTGVTRAKKLVVLVGSKKALAIAVKNNKISKRYTRLADRLRDIV